MSEWARIQLKKMIMNRVLDRGINEKSRLGDFRGFPDNVDSSVWYYYEVIEASNAHEYEGSRPSEQWTSNQIDFNYDMDKYERP